MNSLNFEKWIGKKLLYNILQNSVLLWIIFHIILYNTLIQLINQLLNILKRKILFD